MKYIKKLEPDVVPDYAKIINLLGDKFKLIQYRHMLSLSMSWKVKKGPEPESQIREIISLSSDNSFNSFGSKVIKIHNNLGVNSPQTNNVDKCSKYEGSKMRNCYQGRQRAFKQGSYKIKSNLNPILPKEFFGSAIYQVPSKNNSR